MKALEYANCQSCLVDGYGPLEHHKPRKLNDIGQLL
jgi:hypothetical protein